MPIIREENTNIPTHIHDIFKNGLPADFRLIGATTRTPNEIPPAIRSRCMEVFFRELDRDEIMAVAKNAAERVKWQLVRKGYKRFRIMHEMVEKLSIWFKRLQDLY